MNYFIYFDESGSFVDRTDGDEFSLIAGIIIPEKLDSKKLKDRLKAICTSPLFSIDYTNDLHLSILRKKFKESNDTKGYQSLLNQVFSAFHETAGGYNYHFFAIENIGKFSSPGQNHVELYINIAGEGLSKILVNLSKSEDELNRFIICPASRQESSSKIGMQRINIEKPLREKILSEWVRNGFYNYFHNSERSLTINVDFASSNSLLKICDFICNIVYRIKQRDIVDSFLDIDRIIYEKYIQPPLRGFEYYFNVLSNFDSSINYINSGNITSALYEYIQGIININHTDRESKKYYNESLKHTRPIVINALIELESSRLKRCFNSLLDIVEEYLVDNPYGLTLEFTNEIILLLQELLKNGYRENRISGIMFRCGMIKVQAMNHMGRTAEAIGTEEKSSLHLPALLADPSNMGMVMEMYNRSSISFMDEYYFDRSLERLITITKYYEDYMELMHTISSEIADDIRHVPYGMALGSLGQYYHKRSKIEPVLSGEYHIKAQETFILSRKHFEDDNDFLRQTVYLINSAIDYGKKDDCIRYFREIHESCRDDISILVHVLDNSSKNGYLFVLSSYMKYINKFTDEKDTLNIINGRLTKFIGHYIPKNQHPEDVIFRDIGVFKYTKIKKSDEGIYFLDKSMDTLMEQPGSTILNAIRLSCLLHKLIIYDALKKEKDFRTTAVELKITFDFLLSREYAGRVFKSYISIPDMKMGKLDNGLIKECLGKILY